MRDRGEFSLNGGTGERDWLNPQPADAVGAIAMKDRPDLVWIKFIRDVRLGDNSVDYCSGSQWQVDAATASALIVMGAAVRIPIQQTQAGPSSTE